MPRLEHFKELLLTVTGVRSFVFEIQSSPSAPLALHICVCEHVRTFRTRLRLREHCTYAHTRTRTRTLCTYGKFKSCVSLRRFVCPRPRMCASRTRFKLHRYVRFGERSATQLELFFEHFMRSGSRRPAGREYKTMISLARRAVYTRPYILLLSNANIYNVCFRRSVF